VKPLILTALTLVFACTSASAQTSLSPYSRFAFGDLISAGGVAQHGMAGLGAAWLDRSAINSANPAAASFLHRTTFQSGIGVHGLELTEGSASGEGWFGGISEAEFVLKQRSGRGAFQFGIRPLSGSGYAITEQFEQEGIGDVAISYIGSGGLSEAHLGWSYRFDGQRWHAFEAAAGQPMDSLRIVAHGTSFGAQLQQVFGDLAQTRSVDIIDPAYLDMQVKRSALHRGVGLKFGFIHERLIGAVYDVDRKLRASTLLRIGATASPGFGLSVDETTEWSTTQELSGIVTQIDSVHLESGVVETEFPLTWSVGVHLERNTAEGRRIEVGLEMGVADWRQSNPDLLDPGIAFTEASHQAFGLSYTPRRLKDSENLLDRSTYRVGLRNAAGYLTFDGNRALTKILSVGATAPMMGSRSGSQFHFGIEIGQRAIEGSEGALIEDLLTFRFGVSLSPFFKNIWLVPRRYD
jgi:hypothetical protein